MNKLMNKRTDGLTWRGEASHKCQRLPPARMAGEWQQT